MLSDIEMSNDWKGFKPEIRKVGRGVSFIVRYDTYFNEQSLVRRLHNKRSSTQKVLAGDYLCFHNWHNGDYKNLLMEFLPLLAWLDQEVVQKDTKFILLDLPVTKSVLSHLDPHFNENRLVWINPDEVIHVTGVLTVVMPVSFRTQGFMSNLIFWLRSLYPEPVVRDKIIFFGRNSAEVHNGHKIDPKNEAEAISVIRDKISKQLGRSGDELIIFNGLKENGQKISFEEQFELFSIAQTIIGPYGDGLANIVWSAAHPSIDCSHRTQILEFFSTDSFYSVFHGLPVDHHLIQFTRKSTSSTTFINITDLENALDSLWQQRHS